jgi:D-alanine-D-alanine ligase
VLGNENPIASVAGEIIPQHGHEFYSYDAKYIDPNGALLKIPVELPRHILKKIQHTAIAAFKVLCLEGMARVDFFLKPNWGIVVNEVNTIPGFTNISMYPKLWEASGLSYANLIDRLIRLAISRHKEEQKLRVSCQ